MKRAMQTDDEKVKAKLIEAIEATGNKDWQALAALGNTYAKIRHTELKLEEGQWGEQLAAPDEVTPDLDHVPRMAAT